MLPDGSVSLCFSNFSSAVSLIFLYFFESVLLSFPHFRWFTTVLAVKTGVVSLGLLKVGDDSWGVVGSDHSPRSQEEEKQNQIQPYILPLLKKAKNKHCGWMDGRCLHICVCGVLDCCVVAAVLSGFQVSHWCSTALPEDDVLLTPYRQRHQRFWHTHNGF